MTEEANEVKVDKPAITVEEADKLLETAWRQTLPEAFRPIAERYGKHKFALAYNIGGCNEAMQKIAFRTKNSNELRHACQFAVGAMNQITNYALLGLGMEIKEVMEIQQDIERASMLQQAAPTPGGKIILAS